MMGWSSPSEEMNKKKSLIIDGYGLIYRSYYGFINNPMRSSNRGKHQRRLRVFTTLPKLVREEEIDYISVAMDSAGPTFRHELYEPYKANRDAAPEDLHSQVPHIKAILKALGVPFLSISAGRRMISSRWPMRRLRMESIR